MIKPVKHSDLIPGRIYRDHPASNYKFIYVGLEHEPVRCIVFKSMMMSHSYSEDDDGFIRFRYNPDNSYWCSNSADTKIKFGRNPK